MDAHDVRFRHGRQPHRIGFAQIALVGKRQTAQIVHRFQVAGVKTGKLLPVKGALHGMDNGGADAGKLFRRGLVCSVVHDNPFI